MMNNNQNIPPGYKDSQLGVIPQEWKVKRLGELGDFLKGSGVPKDKIIDIGFPCLTYGDIYTKYDYVIKNISQYIDEKTASESKQIIKGDILFAGSGETLKDIGKNVAFVDDAQTYAGGDIIIFRPKTEIDNITLSYILGSVNSDRQKYRMGQGHSVVHIYTKNLEKLLVAIPPLEEQRRIAEVLGCWDEAIERQGRIVELLTTRKRALMQRLLTPKPHWQKTKLGDIAQIYQPQTIQGENFVNNGFPVYGANGFIGYYHSYNHETEQTVITCRGSSCGTINFTPSKCWITGNAMVVNIDSNRYIDKIFFNSLMLFSSFQHIISGSGQPQIVKEPLLKYNISIPPLAEQKSIAGKLSTADAQIDLERRHLDLLRTQKRSLMQQLLTGKKRLKIQ